MAAAGHGDDDYALLRDGQGRRRGALSGARDRDSGRQGFAVDAHGLATRTATRARCAAPVSLVVSAFAPVADVRRTLTPELAATAATRCCSARSGRRAAAARRLVSGAELRRLRRQRRRIVEDAGAAHSASSRRSARCATRGLVLAYHDRSDGGLLVTLLEMAFASHARSRYRGARPSRRRARVSVRRGARRRLQIARRGLRVRRDCSSSMGFDDSRVVARRARMRRSRSRIAARRCCGARRVERHAKWSELSYRMQALRDNPDCAREAYESCSMTSDPGLNAALTFELPSRRAAPRPRVTGQRPRVADAARAGRQRSARDGRRARPRRLRGLRRAHERLARGPCQARTFRGLVACGGFSYGDVLGAGEGWAKSILYNDRCATQFRRSSRGRIRSRSASATAARCWRRSSADSGRRAWPRFLRNRSDQFEARLSLVRIEPGPSILLARDGGLAAADRDLARRRPRRVRSSERAGGVRAGAGCAALRRQRGRADRALPGQSERLAAGIAGLTTPDGRVTIMMPHPERVFRTVQHSWHPAEWGEGSPWQRLFDNARRWVDAAG